MVCTIDSWRWYRLLQWGVFMFVFKLQFIEYLVLIFHSNHHSFTKHTIGNITLILLNDRLIHVDVTYNFNALFIFVRRLSEQWWHQGGHEGQMPPVRGSAPTPPPRQKAKNDTNQPISNFFKKNCPLSYAFFPPRCPHNFFSGATIVSESLRLIGSAMFGATFNLVTRVWLPLFLRHWKMVALNR